MSEKVMVYRRRKGMTQQELADKVGVSRFHINKIENGKSKMSVGLALRIAKTLDVTLNDIFFD
jgi:putative transcriptional regulator